MMVQLSIDQTTVGAFLLQKGQVTGHDDPCESGH